MVLMVLNVILSMIISVLILFTNKKIKYEHDYPTIFIIFSGILGILCSLKLSILPQRIIYTSMLIILINIAFIDIKYLEIPNTYNILILTLGITNIMILKSFYPLVIAAISFLFFFIISIFSKGALGGGDVKLALGLGLFLNLPIYMHFLMYTFGAGALAAAVLLILKKKNKSDKIPFGPFMSIGTILAVLI